MNTQNRLRSDNEHGTVCPKTEAKLRPKRCGLIKWLLPITGLTALAWFLIRVIPKPSRATYPCQRVAAPFASSFVVWLLGLVGSTMFVRKARKSWLKARYVVAAACFVAAVFTIWWSAGMTGRYARAGYGVLSRLSIRRTAQWELARVCIPVALYGYTTRILLPGRRVAGIGGMTIIRILTG